MEKEIKPSIVKPIKINKVNNIAGFTANNALAGEDVRVIYKGFFHSDQKIFYEYIEELSNIYLNRYLVNRIHNFLIIIHPDLTADLYINEVPIFLKIISKRDILAREAVTINDIADITELCFADYVDLKENYKLIFCFKVGWKFGLYFDFHNTTNPHYSLNLQELWKVFGYYYKFLLFQKEYSILQNKFLFEEMFKDGWFPFIRLLGGDFRKLAEIYKNRFDFENSINKFIDSFNENKIKSIINSWWRKQIVKDKEAIIKARINAYLQNNQDGYINCIKNLYPEIEGIIRMSYFNEKNKNPSMKDLMDFVEKRAKNKFVSIESLGFPSEFYRYLKDVFFKDFNLLSNDCSLSRHTTSHGVAKPEDYTKIKALQSILILDQIVFSIF
ncbi:MAG: hypothetical protein GX428_09630 [Candidatus Atribacteria bacterium]|nr:hypothetical protein [Candidatus Atribacteria bacterium]